MKRNTNVGVSRWLKINLHDHPFDRRGELSVFALDLTRSNDQRIIKKFNFLSKVIGKVILLELYANFRRPRISLLRQRTCKISVNPFVRPYKIL